MTTIILLLLAFAVIALVERGSGQVPFALSAFAAVVAAMLLLVGDLERATLLAAIVAAAIVGASRIKQPHSGMKLTVADLALPFAGTLPFLIVQYPRAVAAAAGGSVMLTLAGVATIVTAQGEPLALGLRATLLPIAVIATLLAFRASGGAAGFRQTRTQRRGWLATFMASLIDVASWWPSRGLVMLDVANEPLPLLPAVPARHAVTPDILVIQHESLFDPRLFGLPVGPEIADFLTPPAGIHGALNVDIYGGGSWQSELSLLTGLSSASFGPDAYFIFRKGAGRFHHTLPSSLTALGYRTMLASSCRRGFLDYDTFYRSIGVEERIFSDDLPAPFDVGRFERTSSDAIFLDAVVEVLADRIARDPAPRLLYVLTNFNHGPHDRRLVPPGSLEAERAFALASLPDAHYAEYYARLAETATTWRRLEDRLASALPRRPTLIVHYGDHQPVLTRRLERTLRLPEDERRQFRTFFAIEALHLDLDRAVLPFGSVLDIAFLGTMAQRAAGLPLDAVTATRANLLNECGEAYFQAPSERKRRFHRSLVDLGLIDLAPGRRSDPAPAGVASARRR